ncbi:MAG: hypothetical protein KatS3mg042_0377 [Rhodothermaceae bacterium]|nr:MAG: hypothetical protein KatS3mg042_0377 [Rhodothermaceae bacterium]
MKQHILSRGMFVVLILGIMVPGPVRSAASVIPGDDDPKEALAALQAHAQEAVSKAAWKVFSENLVVALQSDHDGLREAAMRYVIQYNDRVDVRAAVFDVVRLYRDHDNDGLRRMAIVTLGHMDSDWAISFLRLSEDFEQDGALKHTIRAVIEQHRAAGG